MDNAQLQGPAKWTYYYLYKIIDVFSRFVVGWMVAYKESAALAEALISETCLKQEIIKVQLTIHTDNGSSMTAATSGQLLMDLGANIYQEVLEKRSIVLADAYMQHPETFWVRGIPDVKQVPENVWINKPEQEVLRQILAKKI